MLTVHHLENSRSQRVLWLLEELEVPYELIRYERDPQTMLAPAALRAIHPLGKSPVITEDGEALAETGAIVEHLLERHGAPTALFSWAASSGSCLVICATASSTAVVSSCLRRMRVSMVILSPTRSGAPSGKSGRNGRASSTARAKEGRASNRSR